MASPMLALPSAGGSGSDAAARRSTLPMAVLIAGGAVAMAFAGLIAAYLALRSATTTFPPARTSFDNYTATTLVITALMASVTIEWAAYGIRKGFRGQALFGFGVTTMLVAAFLNALNYLINGFEFGAAATPYATVVYAMTGLAFLVALIALGGVILTGLRAVGHQLTTDNFHLVRSVALLWHVAALAWLAVFYTIYITK